MSYVILPASFPRIFTTFRIAVAVGLITTFTAEMMAGGGEKEAMLIYSREPDRVWLHRGDVVYRASSHWTMLSFQRHLLRWAED